MYYNLFLFLSLETATYSTIINEPLQDSCSRSRSFGLKCTEWSVVRDAKNLVLIVHITTVSKAAYVTTN